MVRNTVVGHKHHQSYKTFVPSRMVTKTKPKAIKTRKKLGIKTTSKEKNH